MTDSNILELAKLGDPQAIASLMNQSLESKGMLAKVERQGDCLEVVLEAERVPNRQALTAFVQKGISNLGTQSIRSVRILGQQVGASYPAWMQELQLGSETPFNIQPETGSDISDITVSQSLEDTQIQSRELDADLPLTAPVVQPLDSTPNAPETNELDDLWADEAVPLEQSPDFLQELLSAEALSSRAEPTSDNASRTPTVDPAINSAIGNSPNINQVDINLSPDQDLPPVELSGDAESASNVTDDAAMLSFLDELALEPAESDFPPETFQSQSIYLDDPALEPNRLSADDFQDLTADSTTIEPLPTELWLNSPASEPEEDLLNFLEPLPEVGSAAPEPELDQILDLDSDLNAADFPDATFINQIPALEPQSDLPELAPSEFPPSELIELAELTDSDIVEPRFNSELSNQQLEDLFASEPEVPESFSEEPWTEHLPEVANELPDDLPDSLLDSQLDLQQSLVSQPANQPVSPPALLRDPWLETQSDLEEFTETAFTEAGLADSVSPPDFLTESVLSDQPLEELPELELSDSNSPELNSPEPDSADLDLPTLDFINQSDSRNESSESLEFQSLDWEADLTAELPSLEDVTVGPLDSTLDSTNAAPDATLSDQVAALPEDEADLSLDNFSLEPAEPPVLSETPVESLEQAEPSDSLRSWAEFSDDTELEDDIEELPPDFLQDWEDDPPEFSEFVDAPAPLFTEQPVALNPEPTSDLDLQVAPPSTLETELDLLDLDAPELESPGLEALEQPDSDLPQLDLTDSDGFELDTPLPDLDPEAELQSNTPDNTVLDSTVSDSTISDNAPMDASQPKSQPESGLGAGLGAVAGLGAGLTAGLAARHQAEADPNPVPNLSPDLSQDSLEQGLGDFRDGFVEPLPDDFFEDEANPADWQADLRQVNLDQPLDLKLEDSGDYRIEEISEPAAVDQPTINQPTQLPNDRLPPDRPAPAATASTPVLDATAPQVISESAESHQPSLLWVLVPLVIFIGGLLGFVLLKSKISAPPPPPPPATESVPVPAPASPVPSAPSPASPSSANPTDPNALQVALERADSAVDLGQTAQSVDDWQLVSNRWQQSIELLKAIPASSPSYTAAQQKLAEYQTYLSVAQRKANQPVVAAAPLSLANVASPTPTTSPAASPTASSQASSSLTSPASNLAASLTCSPVVSTASSQPIELSSVQFGDSDKAEPSSIIGCITNHTTQPIATVDVAYVDAATPSTASATSTGKLTFAQLAPRQTVPFKSEFTVVPEVKDLSIASLSWTATGESEPKQLPVTISVTRSADQQG